jgi:hypothetical protein
VEINGAGRLGEVEKVFRSALESIHSALVGYYRLSDEEALEAERDLDVWFHRLVRRGGTLQARVALLRGALLLAACEYGRSFQLWKQGGSAVDDPALSAVLAREPQDIAGDLEKNLDRES